MADARRVGTMAHEKVGHTGQGLWHHKGMQLPAYIQHVANDLIESGHSESNAVQMAVGIIKNWAAGHDGKGGKVSAETQAKAVAALAEWEKLKGQAHTLTAANRAEEAGVEVNGGGNGEGGHSQVSYGEIFRTYPLDGMELVRTGDYADGRTVEAYAAVFDQPAEIRDHEGHYLEIIDRSAFNRVIDHVRRSRGGAASVKVLYNHGMTIHGTPAERFSIPVGVCRDVAADNGGLRTLTRYNETALGDEVLESIREGAITAQSFTGRIVRSDPQLVRGDKHRAQSGGKLTTVRRMELGLREYGPTPFPAYSGAEVLGVRMSLPGSLYDDEEYPGNGDPDLGTSPDGEPAPGSPPEGDEPDGHLDRSYGKRLYQLRTEEALRMAGITLPGR